MLCIDYKNMYLFCSYFLVLNLKIIHDLGFFVITEKQSGPGRCDFNHMIKNNILICLTTPYIRSILKMFTVNSK